MLLVCFLSLHEIHGALHGLDLVGTVCVLMSVLVNMFFKFVALLLTIMTLYVRRSCRSEAEERMCLFFLQIFTKGGFRRL